jgi:hypothetical protein
MHGITGGEAERHRPVEGRLTLAEDAGDTPDESDREIGPSLHGHGARRLGDRQGLASGTDRRVQVTPPGRGPGNRGERFTFLTRSLVSLASGRIRSASAAEPSKSLTTKCSRAFAS